MCVKCSNALREYISLRMYRYHSQLTLQSLLGWNSIIPFTYWYTTSFSGMESNLNFYIIKYNWKLICVEFPLPMFENSGEEEKKVVCTNFLNCKTKSYGIVCFYGIKESQRGVTGRSLWLQATWNTVFFFFLSWGGVKKKL